jgi:Amt family ammonium transporter
MESNLNHIFELQFAMDTFYFLVCGALVMWMAAGFAMLEAGLVRSKNTTEILTKNVALFAISCTMYLICGYQLMYGGGYFLSDITTVAGMDDAAIAGVLAASKESGFGDMGEYAGASDFFFQVVFVATAMSIVSGAVAERMKLWAFLAFAVVMTGFIYPMEGGWSWGGNLLPFMDYTLSGDCTVLADCGEGDTLGFGYSDYAGSGIVHMAGAAAALAGVLLLGARKGKYGPNGEVRAIPGANLPLATLGMFILWMGWFGFNGGSTLKLGGIAVANEVANVFLNTNAAASGGLIAALITGYILFRKADLTMALNGALAGLVAITAEPADPSPFVATLIGAAGGVLVVLSILTLDKLKIDDPVGAISVHGVVGIWGIFAVLISDPEATFMGQLVGTLTIFIWVFVTSLIVWGVLKAIMGLRVSEEQEYEGVDIAECGMEAYPEFTSK